MDMPNRKDRDTATAAWISAVEHHYKEICEELRHTPLPEERIKEQIDLWIEFIQQKIPAFLHDNKELANAINAREIIVDNEGNPVSLDAETVREAIHEATSEESSESCRYKISGGNISRVNGLSNEGIVSSSASREQNLRYDAVCFFVKGKLIEHMLKNLGHDDFTPLSYAVNKALSTSKEFLKNIFAKEEEKEEEEAFLAKSENTTLNEFKGLFDGMISQLPAQEKEQCATACRSFLRQMREDRAHYKNHLNNFEKSIEKAIKKSTHTGFFSEISLLFKALKTSFLESKPFGDAYREVKEQNKTLLSNFEQFKTTVTAIQTTEAGKAAPPPTTTPTKTGPS